MRFKWSEQFERGGRAASGSVWVLLVTVTGRSADCLGIGGS